MIFANWVTSYRAAYAHCLWAISVDCLWDFCGISWELLWNFIGVGGNGGAARDAVDHHGICCDLTSARMCTCVCACASLAAGGSPLGGAAGPRGGPRGTPARAQSSVCVCASG